MQREFETFKNLIEQSNSFVLTTHINPDGDGLGSELALWSFLTRIGKSALIFNHSPLPPTYGFLDRNNVVKQFIGSSHNDILRHTDVIVVLDTNQSGRLASLQEPVLSSKAKKIVIDHHLDTEQFAHLSIIDDSAAATGEILYRFLAFLEGPVLSSEIADSLYVAIMTDTGSFRFPKTDSELHRITAQLIDSGADPVRLYQQVYEQGPPNRLRLFGKTLANLEVTNDGKIALLTVTQQMFRETGTDESDTDTFITSTLAIKDVQIGLMVTELKEGVKISFRSRGEIRINELAKEFGGNGHKNAAGARVTGMPVRTVIKQVLEQSKKYVTS